MRLLQQRIGVWLLSIILPLAGAVSASAAGGPITLDIQPEKNIYTRREGVSVRFVLTAKTRAKVCLEKDILSQMQITLHRAGKGKLTVEPLVVHSNQALFEEPLKVRWLEPGETLTLRANLKRFKFAGGEQWAPGEYSVHAAFLLCEQNDLETVTDLGKEMRVPATRHGWFMIMN